VSKIKPGWLMEKRGSRTPATMAVPGSIVLNGAYDTAVTSIRFSPAGSHERRCNSRAAIARFSLGFKVQVK
jgi:hypothetical protein